jgi:hypothetical protein
MELVSLFLINNKNPLIKYSVILFCGIDLNFQNKVLETTIVVMTTDSVATVAAFAWVFVGPGILCSIGSPLALLNKVLHWI